MGKVVPIDLPYEIDMSALSACELLKFHNFLVFLYHQLKQEVQKVQFHADYKPLSYAVKYMQAAYVKARTEERIAQMQKLIRDERKKEMCGEFY